ncbi:MAG: hypothetical protein AB1792_11185 [Candidatus Zixiibacteriota bacterium]
MRNVLFVGALVCLLAGVGRADVPTSMNIQGRLTDSAGVPVPAGLYGISFRIWSRDVGGKAIWPMAGPEIQQVTIEDGGLWNAHVGAEEPLTADIFSDTARWLEIVVDDGVNPPQTFPRLKLNSGPFAYSAPGDDNRYVNVTGDSMSGALIVPLVAVGWPGQWGALYTRDDAGNTTIALEPDVSGEGGYLAVRRSTTTAGFSVDRNYLGTLSPKVSITGPSRSAVFNMASSGDASVVLPDDAIAADETANETGIAATAQSAAKTFTQGAADFSDVVTVSITVPSAGYIVVQARGLFSPYNTTGCNRIHVQIDETEGGGSDMDNQITVGLPQYASVTAGDYAFPFYVDRIYYAAAAGTYEYRLEGKAHPDNAVGAVSRCFYRGITATFHPTSYGSVVVPMAAQVGNPATGGSTEVDLRELEIRTLRARIEAERLARELEETQSHQQSPDGER